MFSLSTGLIHSAFDDGWDTVFTDPVLELRDGTRPADADTADIGSLLCTVALPATGYFAAAAALVKAKAGTWTGTVAASGTPTWFRIMNGTDDGGASTTLPRIDGDVGMDGGNGDISFAETSLAYDDTVNIDTFTISWAEIPSTMAAAGTVT